MWQYRGFFIFCGLFLFVNLHAQRKDTTLYITPDSTCYLKLPLERIAEHHTIRPVLECGLSNISIIHVSLIDRWGTVIFESNSLEEQWEAKTDEWPASCRDFTWKIRIEIDDNMHGKQVLNFSSPLYIIL